MSVASTAYESGERWALALQTLFNVDPTNPADDEEQMAAALAALWMGEVTIMKIDGSALDIAGIRKAAVTARTASAKGAGFVLAICEYEHPDADGFFRGLLSMTTVASADMHNVSIEIKGQLDLEGRRALTVDCRSMAASSSSSDADDE